MSVPVLAKEPVDAWNDLKKHHGQHFSGRYANGGLTCGADENDALSMDSFRRKVEKAALIWCGSCLASPTVHCRRASLYHTMNPHRAYSHARHLTHRSLV
jgi:hypothetical protein